MEIRIATCSSRRGHMHGCEVIWSYGLCIAFDPLATLLHRWISWPVETKKLGRSEVGLAVVIVSSSSSSSSTVRVPGSRFMTPCRGWRPCDFSLLETRNLCTHIICPISNFQFHMAKPAMWVTRQIATHTVALIDYLSALRRSVIVPSPCIFLVELKWVIRDSVDDPRGREETTGKEPRLRPNVGRFEVRLSRWTSLRRFQTSPESFSSWQKRVSSSDVPVGTSSRRVFNSLEIFRAACRKETRKGAPHLNIGNRSATETTR